MAGRGPAPKPPDQRRRANQVARGEWVALPAEFDPTLPEEPPRAARQRKLHARTQLAWAAWRADPASSQWGPAEVLAVEELAFIHDDYWRSDRAPSYLAEMRQREDRLGLSAKGKRTFGGSLRRSVASRLGRQRSNRWRPSGICGRSTREEHDEMEARAIVKDERYNNVEVRPNGDGDVWLKVEPDADGEVCVNADDLIEAMQFVVEAQAKREREEAAA